MRLLPVLTVLALVLPLARSAWGQGGGGGGGGGGARWNGYLQLRYTGSRDVAGFSVRRAKLWLKGPAPVIEHLTFKVQGLFRTPNRGSFTLQDAYVEYGSGPASIKAGQMVPDYSRERKQPDAFIPLVERAAAINVLIPTATTGARDIGVQFTLRPPNGAWHLGVGLFNGTGGNAFKQDTRGVLVTGRGTWALDLGSGVTWELGGSAAYRRAVGLVFRKLLGTDQSIDGDDFRWGLETRLSGPRWEVQSEYLRARVAGRSAWGYYALAGYHLAPGYQLVVSTERLALPIPSSRDDPWYIIGLNWLVSGQDVKFMVDTRVRPGGRRTDYAGTIQFQVFVN